MTLVADVPGSRIRPDSEWRFVPMRLTSLLLCWTAVVAAPALGSERPLVPPSRSASEGATERKVTGWFEQLDAAHEEVLAQEWKKATRRLETVEREVGHVFIEGAGAQRLFGQLSLLWALVHAGRGDQEVAARGGSCVER